MARSIIKNPTREATKIVLGDIDLLNFNGLALKTGIPIATLYRHQKDVGALSAERFAKICKARDLSDDAIVTAVRILAREVL